MLIVLLLDLTNHVNPQIKGEVFPLRIAKLPSKLFFVSSSEHVDVQTGTNGQVLDILTIMLRVATEFRQREVMSLECFELKVFELTWEYVNQSVGVMPRYLSDSDHIEMDAMTFREFGFLSSDSCEIGQIGTSPCLVDVHISGGSRQPIKGSNRKAA